MTPIKVRKNAKNGKTGCHFYRQKGTNIFLTYLESSFQNGETISTVSLTPTSFRPKFILILIHIRGSSSDGPIKKPIFFTVLEIPILNEEKRFLWTLAQCSSLTPKKALLVKKNGNLDLKKRKQKIDKCC